MRLTCRCGADTNPNEDFCDQHAPAYPSNDGADPAPAPITAAELDEIERRARIVHQAFGRLPQDMALMLRLARELRATRAELAALQAAARTLATFEHVQPIEGSISSTVRTEDVARLRELAGPPRRR